MKHEQELHAEAERLAALPADVQQRIIALHRSVADDPEVPKRDRDLARERVYVLERHLRWMNRVTK